MVAVNPNGEAGNPIYASLRRGGSVLATLRLTRYLWWNVGLEVEVWHVPESLSQLRGKRYNNVLDAARRIFADLNDPREDLYEALEVYLLGVTHEALEASLRTIAYTTQGQLRSSGHCPDHAATKVHCFDMSQVVETAQKADPLPQWVPLAWLRPFAPHTMLPPEVNTKVEAMMRKGEHIPRPRARPRQESAGSSTAGTKRAREGEVPRAPVYDDAQRAWDAWSAVGYQVDRCGFVWRDQKLLTPWLVASVRAHHRLADPVKAAAAASALLHGSGQSGWHAALLMDPNGPAWSAPLCDSLVATCRGGSVV